MRLARTPSSRRRCRCSRKSRVYGQLCILWGEIALRAEEWERATQRLVKPTYAIQDEAITPTALFKSAAAHEALGQNDKAAELRAQLKEKFPRYDTDEGAIKGLPAKA
jgi:TolA-binding protein